MLNAFWNWIVQSVNSALNLLNNLVNNSITAGFMELLLVVVLMACLMHFIIKPLIGFSMSAGKSDKVKKTQQQEDN